MATQQPNPLGLHPCPKCGNMLVPKVAKGGLTPGYPYVHCVLPCKYHFRFSPPPIANVIPPLENSFVPLSSLSTTPSSSQALCPVCSKSANGNCGNRMCKNHCILNMGGCSLTDHKPGRLSSRQQKRAHCPDSLAVNHRSSTLPTAPGPSSMVPGVHMRGRTADGDGEAEQTLEELEEAQMRHALALSLAPEPPAIDPDLNLPLQTIPTTPQRAKICTIPYKSKPITRHMNDHWMREPDDKTKHPKKFTSNNGLDTCFTLVFWQYPMAEPTVLAIHDCPRWPKWILKDALDLYDNLGFDSDAPPSSRKIQYYSFQVSQWISCASSFPHTVKKEGYLLLCPRNIDHTDCMDFEDYKKLALSVMPHFRDNLPGERTSVRYALQDRQQASHIHVISSSDVESETARYHRRKHQHEEDSEPGPSHKHQLVSPFSDSPSPPPPWLLSPYPLLSHSKRLATPELAEPPSHSPSITVSSPHPIPISSPSIACTSPRPIFSAPPLSPLRDIQLPDTCKWPENMFAVDMARIFRLFDSPSLKKDYPQLRSRIHAVLNYTVPESTFQEQRRHWNCASEKERDLILAAGRTSAGSWVNLPKRGCGRL